MSTPPFIRLMAKVVQSPDGCWLWTGCPDSKGYAQISYSPGDGSHTMLRGHRVAYEELVGPIPEGKELDHLCRVRNCVNPLHLEPVTHRENTMRGEGASVMAARRTECPNGHTYDERNSKGQRACSICRKAAQARADAKRRPPNGRGRGWKSERTHCPQGHEYTEANTHRRADGSRSCRACAAEGARIRRQRKE